MTASALNSFPMSGIAILIEDIINGVIKELREAIVRAVNLVALSFIEMYFPERSCFIIETTFHKTFQQSIG
jgi:hypothetical protein